MKKFALDITQPPSIQQSQEKCLSRNFSYLTKLDGDHNQPCGSPEISPGNNYLSFCTPAIDFVHSNHQQQSRNKWQPEQFVAVKITNNNNTEETQHEKEIEYHIAHLNPEHRGHLILRTCLDAFDLIGPKGKHMCLVYEPMREPLWIFRKRFISRQIPLPIAKTYIFFLLVGLDYLHSECKIVHTGDTLFPFYLRITSTNTLLDLKLDNILMSFESDEILTSFVKKKLQMGCKLDEKSGQAIY